MGLIPNGVCAAQQGQFEAAFDKFYTAKEAQANGDKNAPVDALFQQLQAPRDEFLGCLKAHTPPNTVNQQIEKAFKQ